MEITQTDTDRIRLLLETFHPDTSDVSFTTIANANAFLKQFGLMPPYKGVNQLFIGTNTYQVEYTWQVRWIYNEGPPARLWENMKIKALTIKLTKIKDE
ncbi:hypothetical protein [Spirosoma areae]